MKNWVYLICFAVLLKPGIPVLDYLVNYDYIRTELCVNKEKPILGCNGKCYLMKELAKASESEKPISSDKKHAAAETIDLFFFEQDYRSVISFDTTTRVVNSIYTNLYSNLAMDRIFHPPAAIS